MNRTDQAAPRILAYRVAQVTRELSPQECKEVSGAGFMEKLLPIAVKQLKSTSFSGPDGGADDCQEPTP